MKKSQPVLKTDHEAEFFVKDVDLTEFDLLGMLTIRSQFESGGKRLPEADVATLVADITLEMCTQKQIGARPKASKRRVERASHRVV
jgi:hypothetical protein